MGKQLNDLKALDDTPIEQPSDDSPQQPWYQFVGEIDTLLADDNYLWAYDTLCGIKETVEHFRRVSDGQRRAVDNIRHGSRWDAGTGAASRRRYEGWGRR